MTTQVSRTRLATPADAAAIAAIYNEGIADRIATFETEPRTPEQLKAQLVDKGDRFPTVVVERDGHVIAWASASAYSSRPVYVGVAEHSVYVARSARGTGAGRAALEALCHAYAERGFWKLVSRIFPENTASLALHERGGFRVVGILRRHGKLEGQWRDCVIVERLLDRPRVLFLCTHNSARSQMAEGFLRALAGDRFEAASAGTEKTSVNPLAIRAMAERGIDISGHASKTIDGLLHEGWDYLITVCDDANERCPFVPGIQNRLHWSFPDPSRATGSEEGRLAAFRRVRDQIEARLAEWLGQRERA